MSSPEPWAVARMITLAPTIFLKGSGSGRSLDPKGGGRYFVGRCQPASAPPSRPVVSAMAYPLLCLASQRVNPYKPKDAIARDPAHPPIGRTSENAPPMLLGE